MLTNTFSMMLIVSSKGIIVKSEARSRIAVKRLEFWFKMSREN